MIKYYANKYWFSLILLISLTAYSQQIKRIDPKQEFIDATVNTIEKDSLGYLWIGTEQGLKKYAGTALKNYEFPNNEDIVGRGIVAIKNIKGELYLISHNGTLFKYEYEYDTFTTLFTLQGATFLSFDKITDEQLIIGLASGFIIYDLANNTASEILHKDIILNKTVRFYDGKIYSGTSKGFFSFTYNQSSKTLTVEKKIITEQDIIHFTIDKQGRCWIGTEVGGLFILQHDELTQKTLSKIENKTYAIRKIAFDTYNKVLVAVDRLGLFVLDEDGNVIKNYTHEADNDNSLTQNGIYEIYVDDTNAYWLGIQDGGLNIVYEKDSVFSNIFHIRDNNNSISNNSIRAIYEGADDALWFGTENGVSKLKEGNWVNYNKNPKLYNTAVLAINSFKDQLVLGTYGEGILALNDDVVTEVKLSEKLPLDFVFHINKFKNDLWIGASDGPLSHYKDGQLLNNYPMGVERFVVEGFDDIVYVASSAGLFEINNRNASFRRLAKDIFNSSNECYHLNFDRLNNCIWIGTKKGLYKFNLRTETVEAIGEKFRSQIRTVFSIQRDNQNNLYLSCLSGLWRYDIKKEIFRKFDSNDGLLIERFGFGATALLKDGRIAFGGPKGATIFNPLNLELDQPIQNIHIKNFTINGKEPDSTLLAKNINYTKTLQLPYDNNSISFNFEALKFHGATRNLFEWQLKGYDENVRYSYTDEKITYSNLEPGDYVLTYSGYNADGVKSDTKTISINIKKPFWKTYLAYAIYILTFFTIGYLMYRVSEANNRKKFNENKIKFFVDVAHDIRTPVSLIQLLVQQLHTQENTEESLKLIERNSQNLNEYVTQLLDFQKIDNKQLKLNISEIDLKDCLAKITSDFTPILNEKQITLQLKVKHLSVWFDVPKMRRIFYNIISNAIKYTGEGGQITISSFLDDKNLKISFKDNGIGIPEKQLDLIFKRFTRGTNVSNKGIPGTGIGLMLSKKIVELHGGKILLESKENEGSIFTVVLPNGKESYNSEDIIHEKSVGEETKDIDQFIAKNKLILLVEDNDELRQAVKTTLQDNFTIIEATNGKEGLLKALSKNPDLIITDIMMPVMDGKELCKLLKSNFKTSHIPVIMLTALADMEDKIKGLETGADSYVEKPLNVDILKATIKNLINSRENVRQILGDEEVTKNLTPDERFLSEVIDSIKDNITNKDFSIDTLCEMMGLSRSNLFRKLKGLIQMSPSDLILKIKLDKAEELMKQKRFTRISDIAYESGFHDPKYFSTLFKKHYNKTPKEFIDSL
ncbi:two component regulator with propeller domain [Kordia periserrulae]|uniref:histidine kinase n=1 Tax=Kordia periserrulae TaxID=701523 RepID=A0A2T6C0A2_9FLAO|nr:ATP-binding protein [Kordia periserrulae]PTX61738.1 two component regulator with propeller domain [Kordia periserrulae]